jgi:hypothetical protein
MNRNTVHALRAAAIVLAPALVLLVVLWLKPPLVAEVSQLHGVGWSAVAVAPGAGVEQTLRAAGDHVDGAAVMVAPAGVKHGTVTVAVRTAGDGAGSSGDQAGRNAVVPLGDISDWQLVQVRFPRLQTLPNQELLLSVTSTPPVFVAGAGYDTYADGALRAGSTAGQPNDLIFRVYRRMAARDWVTVMVGSPVWVVALGLVLAGLAAGWALLLLLEVGKNQVPMSEQAGG